MRLDWIEGGTLAQGLRREGLGISLPCGGKGRCGKCRVKTLEGAPAPLERERELLTPEELAEGWRLACLRRPVAGACQVEPPPERDFWALAEFEEAGTSRPLGPDRGETVLAVDIGTTTLAFCLARGGEVLERRTAVNPQRSYGADVLSRIQAAIQGEGEALRALLCRAVAEGIREIGGEAERVGLAGNTAMLHLLRGYDCRGLGSFPFTPVSLTRESLPLGELLGEAGLPDVAAELLPGCSAFVGADIGAGLLAAGFDRLDAPAFFLDLGTNGEMALWTGREILIASAPAGPSFEGGGLSCGVGSIAGAICGAGLEQGRLVLRTIGGAAPVGLCGTGAVELLYGLLQGGVLDRTGALCPPYDRVGFPLAKDEAGKLLALTQEDIRQMQLAKAAVRAGAEVLLGKAGLLPGQVETVFVAGGFGRALGEEAALGIGLLPPGFAGKLLPLGNTALAGTLRFLTEPNAPERLGEIIGQCREIVLAGSQDFEEAYLGQMEF